MNKHQTQLLTDVAANPGLNTRQLREKLFPETGQAYEQTLVERLMLLAQRGFLRFEEDRGPSGAVTARRWHRTEKEVNHG